MHGVKRTAARMLATRIAPAFRSARPEVFTGRTLAERLRALVRATSLSDEPASSVDALLSALIELGVVTKAVLNSRGYPSISRYLAGGPTPLQIAASLRPTGYLSHASAAFIHGLNDEPIGTAYVNAEQSPKPGSDVELSQLAIARAFARPQRASRYVFTFDKCQYVILSGKHTDDLGVITLTHSDGTSLRTTDLERTLVDLVVRPSYAGGVDRLRVAFKRSMNRVSIPHLLGTLRALDHVYPYHQALGLLFERVGMPSAELEPLRALKIEFDFYLAHGMKQPVFDAGWRIYHPNGF